MDVQKSFYSFFRFYVFVKKKRTVIARKLIFFFRKYRYFNSLLNATHPIQIHSAVLEKLRFEKKVNKILTSISLKFMDQPFCPTNSTENYQEASSKKNFAAVK